MFKKILIFVGLLFCVTQTSQAQQLLRSYSNEFLALGVGARGLAMGNVQAASVNDVTSSYWNPAGLNHIEELQVGLMHAEWFAGIGKYDYIGLATPISGDRAVGLSIIRFGVDDIPNTLNIVDGDGNIDYDRITTFSAADYGFLLSYAQKWGNNDKLRVGGNVKIVHRRVGDFANSWGFGIDLGAQYDLSDDLTLAVSAKDITTTFNAWSFDFTDEEKELLELTDNVIPVNSVELTGQRIILGASYDLELTDKINLLTELNLDLTFDERNTLLHTSFLSIDPHLGIEAGYDIGEDDDGKGIFLRLGINNIQRFLDDDDIEKTVLGIQPNVGLGLGLGNINIDYALTGFSNISQGIYSHVFSLRLHLKSGKKY